MTETQSIEASDGHRIALHVSRPAGEDARHVAILLHGIFANHSESGRFDTLSEALAEAGVTVLRFDFRGHGASPWPSTTFTPLGAVRDLHAAVLWCRHNRLTVSFVGSSFGASSVLNYLALHRRDRPRKLVLWNPVIDYRATFIEPELPWGKSLFAPALVERLEDAGSARLMPHFRASVGLYQEMALLEPHRTLAMLDTPTLLLHGDADEKVPFSALRAHEHEFSSSVTVVPLRDVGHGFDADVERDVTARTVSWLSSD